MSSNSPDTRVGGHQPLDGTQRSDYAVQRTYYTGATPVNDLLDAIDGLTYDGAIVELADGRRARIRIEPDYDVSINDYDCYGTVSEGRTNPYTGRNERPADFDGAACKITTIDGPMWWQPFDGYFDLTPEDQRDARWHVGHLASFGFHVVFVEVLAPEDDAYGRPIVLDYDCLGGVDDANDEYVREIVKDLLPPLL